MFVDYARRKHHLFHIHLAFPSFSKGVLWRYLKWSLIYFYFFSFVVWYVLLSTNRLDNFVAFSFTPFFFFPWRMGIVGLLAIILIVFSSHEIAGDKRLLFFAALMALGFTLEQFSSYVISIYPSYRFGTITFVGACPIAAWGLIRILRRQSALSVNRNGFRIVFQSFSIYRRVNDASN